MLQRDYARTTLKPRHRAVVRAFAEALFFHRPPAPPERFDAFVDEVDRFISPASKTLRFGLLLMLDAIRVLPIFFVRRLRTFEALDLETRVRMLERLDRSRFAIFSLLFVAYKTVLSMLFFEHPDELRAIGYPGPERERYKRALPVAPMATPRST